MKMLRNGGQNPNAKRLKGRGLQERWEGEGGLYETGTCRIIKDPDLPREFQGAHRANRKVGCAPHGVGER